MSALRIRKVQAQTEAVESFIFNGKNGSEIVQFFLNRGEQGDNFGDYLIWADPDSGATRRIHLGERVVVIKDQVCIFPDDVFKLIFVTAKSD